MGSLYVWLWQRERAQEFRAEEVAKCTRLLVAIERD